ncbi:Transposase IS66 family protein, partial [Pseudobutyrivibrio sp. ACV-2]|uniref:IS66 family transposase n=1 Tax=Pseudobutyrivibrio sp. ACV-2 TaxID=1520801 RepID=UPI0008992D94
MRADVEKFKNQISGFDKDVLLFLCGKLFEYYLGLSAENTQLQRNIDESAYIYNELKKKYESFESENKQLKELVGLLRDQIELKNKTLFGATTEKFVSLVEAAANHPEEIEDESQVEDDDESKVTNIDDYKNGKGKGAKKGKSSHGKKKSKSKKGYNSSLKESMEKLPKQISYDFDPSYYDEKYGVGNWGVAFWHVHETIEKIPVPYYVKAVYTPVIKVKDTGDIITQPYENQLLDRSHLSPSLLADILYDKYVKGIPLYRQAFNFKIFDIGIIKQTMVNWVNTIVPRYMRHICNRLLEELLTYNHIQSDETYIKVNKDGRSSSSKSYIWVHCSSELIKNPPIIIFCYERSRSTAHLRDLLAEFKGYITCDAYISYQVIEKESEGRIKATGCHMHLRRYFAQALFVNDVLSLSEEELYALPETKVLLKIRDIYSEENKLRELDVHERLLRRKSDIKPLINDLFDYIHELDESKEVYSDRLKKAIGYAINQEELLKRFLEDGNIPIDNGAAERAIRSFSVGRVNWLFADTPLGA